MPVQVHLPDPRRVSPGVPREDVFASRGAGTFPGRVRSDRRFVDLDDQALAAIHDAGGKALVIDSIGDHTAAELEHDGTTFVIRCEASVSREAKRVVEVRARGAR